ncbi:hypothetical protein J3B00_005078 [Pseudomonas sp. BP8]|nr:hypothetical protein [Pseudomonas sp. BP8]
MASRCAILPRLRRGAKIPEFTGRGAERNISLSRTTTRRNLAGGLDIRRMHRHDSRPILFAIFLKSFKELDGGQLTFRQETRKTG